MSASGTKRTFLIASATFSRRFQLVGLTRYDAFLGLWGDEATRIHQVARQCAVIPARCARAAAGTAGRWVSRQRFPRTLCRPIAGFPPRLERRRIYRI